MPDPPEEVLDVRATDDQAKAPEAEAFANVGASTSLPDLAAGASANVGAPTSPPVLDVDVGATTSLSI